MLTTINSTGEFLRKDLIPNYLKFADTITLFEVKEKIQFIAFVSRMLQWQPEKRSTAKDLLEDPFLVLRDENDAQRPI
jgi:serine/threonine-protein kinase SRPK3